MSSPLISGIHALMLGVPDFAPLQRIFTKALEWDVVDEATLECDVCEQFWHTPSRAEVMVLASRSVPYGRVHLCRFPEVAPMEIDAQDPRSLGFRAMNTYVRDMDDARARIDAAGGGWGAETSFDIESVDGSIQTVHQGRALLPHGASLVFVMPTIARWTAAWSRDESVFCPEATSVVVASCDADGSKKFWGPGGLGLEILYDTVQTNPGTNKMLGLEPDAAVRVVFGWGEKTARVEILGRVKDAYQHIGSPDLTAQQRPGVGMGPIGWVIKVASLDEALARMEATGGQIVAGPLAVDNPLHRKRQVATVQTPEKTWLSVWEDR
jgi:predicted enzyme related to lactoylglutathione lyase